MVFGSDIETLFSVTTFRITNDLSTQMYWDHVSKKLSAYLHGELPREEARRTGEHLLGCSRCHAEYEEIKFGAQMVQELAAQTAHEPAPESLWNELELALDRGGVSRAQAK